jgi:hypothetical protein
MATSRKATNICSNHPPSNPQSNESLILIQVITDKDSVVVEITLGNFKLYTVNMYLDITAVMDKTSGTIKDILRLANIRGILITMDSNSRSRMCHDKLTNGRFKKLEVSNM